jgi:hypothetical protein
LGPRDAVEHFGDALAPLPDALAMMPKSLLSTARGADPASRAVAAEAEENGFAEERDLSLGLESDIQVDRETAFEIAARKAAITRSIRDAADEALGDVASAENAARKQAADAGDLADAKQQDANNLRTESLQVFQESQKRDDAFESAICQVETAHQLEEEAARAVAKTDLSEGQAAERLATAEEALRLALEAAEKARAEALTILEEAKQKEEAFAEAHQATENAKEEKESRALAVAEADAAAEAAAELASRDAEVAVRVAQEVSTAAEIVETVVEHELAAIDPDLLKPPKADDPSSTKADWITNMRPLMDVANASMDAGEVAAREAYREALREGSSIEEALERAIIAAEAYGGTKSADQVIAAGPDGLIGGEGEDGLGGGGGFSCGGIDGLFGFGFTFTPIVINVAASKDDDDRDDLISITVATVTINARQGTGLADFLVGNNMASVVGGREGNDFLYGDTPTNYLSGTHNIGNTLTNPTFDSSGLDDLI